MKTPEEYVDSLRKLNPVVYLKGQRNESGFKLTGPKDLGGDRLAISIGGSNPLPIKQVSRDLFESERSFPGGYFAFQIDGVGALVDWMNETYAAKPIAKTAITGKIYLLTTC